MMRAVAFRFVESCLDSTTVKELELDGPIDEASVRRVAEGANLQYYPDFPRPYFRIDRPGAWVAQGVVGASSFRVTFSSRAGPSAEADLVALLEGTPATRV
jgi:hypothetical protein